MTDRVHDVELDTSETVVRALLESHCPNWFRHSMSRLRSSGTDNVMWRLHVAGGDDLVVRLPRTPDAATGVAKELAVLPQLARMSISTAIEIPIVQHAGEPSDAFAHPWAVLRWIDGDDAWTVRHQLAMRSAALATEIAEAVVAIRAIDGVPLPERRPGARGGPLVPLLANLDRWLDDRSWSACDLIDVTAVRRAAAESAEVVDEPVERGVVHGDLIPGNLLTRDGRLTAVIDWSGVAMADIAQDLAPAWSVLDASGRATFRTALGVDDPTWLRARAFELEHAVGAILYYTPRRHPLAVVMARTLDNILSC